VHYRHRETVYHITVIQQGDGGAAGVVVDGVEQDDRAVSLVDDHREHSVEVRVPAPGRNGGGAAPADGETIGGDS
jgi:hypothetical protein